MQVSKRSYLSSAAVRTRYGVSDMTIWRWLHDQKLGFPAPLRINGRRYWNLTQLDAWEASRSAEVPAEGEPALRKPETMMRDAA